MPTEYQPGFDEFAYENLPHGFSTDNTMYSNTVNYLNSLDIDEKVKPLVESIAERRSFDSVQETDNMKERVKQTITDVRRCEDIFLARGDIKEKGHYIPVGGHYFNDKLGLIVLHQEVCENNKLGDKFYITRHVLNEQPKGKYSYSITFMKFSIQDSQEGGVLLSTFNKEDREFPYFKDDRGEFTFKGYLPRARRMDFIGSKEISQKVKEYIGQRKPDPEILKTIIELINQSKEI